MDEDSIYNYQQQNNPLGLYVENIGHDLNRALYIEQSRKTRGGYLAPVPRPGILHLLPPEPDMDIPIMPVIRRSFARRLRRVFRVLTMGAL
jgi:hypothetical protein